MSKILKTLPVFISLMFISCGDGASNSISESSVSQENYKVAIDNVANGVSTTFEGYNVVVYTDKDLEKDPSQSSKAIYGTIEGKNTKSLLSVSGNYSDGDSFKVKVYKDNKLVGESDSVALTGEYVKFNDIQINQE